MSPESANGSPQGAKKAAEGGLARAAWAGVIFAVGGGNTHFDAKKRKDGHDLLAEFANAGYDTVSDRASLLAAPTHAIPLVGMFSPSHRMHPFTLLPVFIAKHAASAASVSKEMQTSKDGEIRETIRKTRPRPRG
jgi:alkaline phosphatase